jgi:uncharacterized protein (TIGR00725 family)
MKYCKIWHLIWKYKGDEMIYQIGVMGSAGGELNEETIQKARMIGLFLAQQGCTIITGGCPGYPYEAVHGYSMYEGPLAVGVSPAINRKEHTVDYGLPTDHFSLMIYTGFGHKGRNVISIRSCDGVIAIGGRTGTLNEITNAYDEGKVLGLLEGSGWAVDKFLESQKDLKKSGGTVLSSPSPEELVGLMIGELNRRVD